MAYVDFLMKLNASTKPDYIQRVVEFDKAECSEIAIQKLREQNVRLTEASLPHNDNPKTFENFQDRPEWSVEGLRHIHMTKKIAGSKITNVRDDQ